MKTNIPTRTITTTTTYYIAEDGTEYETIEEAKNRNYLLSCTKLYGVRRRGYDAVMTQVFSTLEKAKDSIDGLEGYDVFELYLDYDRNRLIQRVTNEQ